MASNNNNILRRDRDRGLNPKDAIGVTKVPLSIVPYSAIVGMALGLHSGGTKYGPFNYRDIPVQTHIYIEAALGHCMSWADGEDYDEESGLSHLYLALSTIAIIIDGLVAGNIIDTRHTLSKPGAGTFSRSLDTTKHRVLADPEKLKELMKRPYVKSVGVNKGEEEEAADD